MSIFWRERPGPSSPGARPGSKIGKCLPWDVADRHDRSDAVAAELAASVR
ncbi:hypothetical protein ACFRKE_22685 [Kitasatospora indigofera]